MVLGPIRHRRARRTDFDAVAAIVAASGFPALPADRATLRRFRRVVADLGADIYVAVDHERVLGVVHVTYTRNLVAAPHAHLELLAVAPEARHRGIGRGLTALAAARASRRGCLALRCDVGAEGEAARAFLDRAGWRAAGEAFMFDLTARGQ